MKEITLEDLKEETIGTDNENGTTPKKRRSFLRKAVFIPAGILIAMLAAVYVGGMMYFQDKFLPNTTINGMDVSGSTVEEVETQVARAASNYHIEIAERDGKKEYLDAEDFGYRYVSRNEVQMFKVEQGSFQWPFSFFRGYDYTFETSTAYDETLLREALLKLDCMQNMTPPSDARVEFNGITYELIKEEEGNQIDAERLVTLIKKVIKAGAGGVSLEDHGVYDEPSVTGSDETLKTLYQNLKSYTDTQVTYTFGNGTEVLNGSIIKGWLTADEAGNVSVDTDAVAQYVAELAAEHDTYGTVRSFQTSDGTFVDVSGGSYGWQLDQAAEIQNILNDLKNSVQETRSPAFARTAVSWENCDLGDSYVEVDLTKQHLWMYLDGRLILDTDFVSGNTSNGHTTPAGFYSLYYKQSPAVLTSTTPGDSYETDVTYWMPFNGGIGFHDATWRSSFGGTIYQTGGSHGCVNLPYDAAAQIYENIYAGFPIVCFYR